MKIGNYEVGNNEKSTRQIAKHAVAANVDEMPPIEFGVNQFIKATHDFEDQKKQTDPLELKIVTEDKDGLGNSEL